MLFWNVTNVREDTDTIGEWDTQRGTVDTDDDGILVWNDRGNVVANRDLSDIFFYNDFLMLFVFDVERGQTKKKEHSTSPRKKWQD